MCRCFYKVFLPSLCLVFASPNRTTAAIGCLTLIVGRVIILFWLSVKKPCFAKPRKTTKLMNHLGGNGCLVLCWVVHRSHLYGGRVYLTCGRPPRNKEIGDVQVVKLPVQPRVILALSWLTKLRELSQTDIGWYLGARPGWSEGLSLKGLVLVFTWPFEKNEYHGKRGWLSLVGKVHNLCRVLKTKYLAVSPVTDNFERHDFEAVW
jgi:hypothetical protein